MIYCNFFRRKHLKNPSFVFVSLNINLAFPESFVSYRDKRPCANHVVCHSKTLIVPNFTTNRFHWTAKMSKQGQSPSSGTRPIFWSEPASPPPEIYPLYDQNIYRFWLLLRGNCSPNVAWFVLYLKIIAIFLKTIYTSFSQLSKDIKNNIKL